MRAVVYEKFGEPGDVLTIEERPIPEPGPGEVRLALILSPVHHHDLEIVRGLYGYKPPLPATPGTEAVARVDALGPGVSHLAVGDRVTVYKDQNIWAEYFLAPARVAVPLPDTVSDEVACQLYVMPATAYVLLESVALRPGQWLAINAANGALGRLVNFLARRRGLRVLSLVRGTAAVTALNELGFDPALDTESEGWLDQIEAVTQGAPITRAIDQLGGKATGDELTLLAKEGRLISLGDLAGESMQLDTDTLIFKRAVIEGYWARSRIDLVPDMQFMRVFGDLIKLAAQGVVPIDIEAAYPLESAAEAAIATETRGRNAKVGLRA
ncbi:zinc-binding dehydrogenase [Nocardia sp. CNY236]|uniref:alcohol dehydrogenase catalytic domain-containing protein n=1 Tax=Nocardia sp. CNY236 TaxID=1169152 RepID=UPI0003FEAC5B|nr:zinc-binding dehydrogenase [Nocardia sp. CNY236]